MRVWFSLTIFAIVGLGSFGCKGSSGHAAGPVSATPTLMTSQNALAFGLEFGSGTFIGTAPVNSLVVTNTGQAPLGITGTTQAGDSAFALQGPNDVSQHRQTTVTYNQQVFYQVVFNPTQARQYNGSFTIHSNASNAPDKVILLTGCGIVADAGTVATYCTLDAGF